MRDHVPKNARLIPKNAECVFKGIVYDTYHWQQEMFDGSIQTFEMLKRPDTVKIIAIKNSGVVVTKQTQPGSKEFYDIPGGMHDVPTENELQAAQRELREETGLVCKNWKLAAVNQPHNKIEQFVYIFVAWDIVEEHEQTLDNGEQIHVEIFDFQNFKERLGSEGFRSPVMKWLESVNSVQELVSLPEFE